MDYELMRSRLVAARERIGYNRKEFAEKLDIPYRTITNYENGAREAGSDYLTKVATVCGVTTDWLLGVSDDETKAPSAAEATPGDDVLDIFNYLNDGLVSLGLLGETEDITKQQGDILIAVARILRAAFDK